MVQRGANLNPTEQAILIAYLAENYGLEATVTVTLADLGLEFGAIEGWQASLYAGAVAGQETAGRFTAWMTVEDGVVVFTLPEDVSEGEEAPWNAEAYVRVRNAAGTFPTFDLVSDPFTLGNSDYIAHFKLDSMYESQASGTAILPWAEIVVHLDDMGGEFGAPGWWQASLYTGPDAGQETAGRFTDWVDAENGVVTFTLATADAPWEEDIYARVRPVDRTNDYPQFDLVGRPFTLVSGNNVHTTIIWERRVVDRALYDVQLYAPVTALTGEANTLVTYTLTLSNTGAADAFAIAASGAVWETYVEPTMTVELALGASIPVTVTVQIPDIETLLLAACDTITITATGQVGWASDSVTLTTCGITTRSIFLPLVMRAAP